MITAEGGVGLYGPGAVMISPHCKAHAQELTYRLDLRPLLSFGAVKNCWGLFCNNSALEKVLSSQVGVLQGEVRGHTASRRLKRYQGLRRNSAIARA